MFLQTPTPDTSGYMIAGYTVAFLVMGIYVASIFIRNRNLNEDKSMLEQMDKTSPKEKPAPKSKKVKTKSRKK